MDAGVPIAEGLSPRVRGNRDAAATRARSQRSIPACAGEPCVAAGEVHVVSVYPRVCGGTVTTIYCPPTFEGLSPRVRGNRPVSVALALRIGSIPACAGEPRPCPSNRRLSAVYPRVCGGTIEVGFTPLKRGGLSPRVRGNLIPIQSMIARQRSIPACAGEPGRITFSRRWRRVYPRVCGGTWTAYTHPWPGWGLSPRVRGNLLLQPATNRYCGSIPACAGEPSATCENPSAHAVYPRVCGGTELGTSQQPARPGLSPRVRGNLDHAYRAPASAGSIPACAGEPGASP